MRLYFASSNSSVRWIASVSYFVRHWATSAFALDKARCSSAFASCSSSYCSLNKSLSCRAPWTAWANALLAYKMFYKTCFLNWTTLCLEIKLLLILLPVVSSVLLVVVEESFLFLYIDSSEILFLPILDLIRPKNVTKIFQSFFSSGFGYDLNFSITFTLNIG